MMSDQPEKAIRLGTRASPLAMAQAHLVRNHLLAAHGWPEEMIEICPVVASGDKILDRALSEVGGKALWTKELDAWLAHGDIDFSVHSMKDVETVRPDKFVIAAMLARGDVRDRLVGAVSIAALAPRARVGTSAPRRRAQLLSLRPDLEICLFRGNVQTRLGKLESGEADATLLAAAGLERLQLDDVGSPISIDEMLPAPSQAAIGIETLAANLRMREWLAPINHQPTYACVMSERALLSGLSGDCRSPIAALATIEGDTLHLRCEIYAEDGCEKEVGALSFAPDDRDAPIHLAQSLLAAAHPTVKAAFR